MSRPNHQNKPAPQVKLQRPIGTGLLNFVNRPFGARKFCCGPTGPGRSCTRLPLDGRCARRPASPQPRRCRHTRSGVCTTARTMWRPHCGCDDRRAGCGDRRAGCGVGRAGCGDSGGWSSATRPDRPAGPPTPPDGPAPPDPARPTRHPAPPAEKFAGPGTIDTCLQLERSAKLSATDSSQLTRPDDEGIVDVRAIKDVPVRPANAPSGSGSDVDARYQPGPA